MSEAESRARWAIIGAGAFGREVAEWIKLTYKTADRVITFYDDTKEPGELIAKRWQVVGPIKGMTTPIVGAGSGRMYVKVVCAIADPVARKKLVESLPEVKFSVMVAGLMAETVVRLRGGRAAPAIIMCPNSVISAGAKVGSHVHMNLGALVGHDAIVGDYCTLSCQTDIMGGVELGEGVFVGGGARVLPGIKVGAWATIGAGSVVMRDVTVGTTVMGNPARVI